MPVRLDSLALLLALLGGLVGGAVTSQLAPAWSCAIPLSAENSTSPHCVSVGR